MSTYNGFNLPVPFKYGLTFDGGSIIAMALVYVITSIEAYGDITANSMISGQPIEGEKYMKRVSGGITTGGLTAILANGLIRIKG